MSQNASKLDNDVTKAMQEMTIKSPVHKHSSRCARLSWSAFGMVNSSHSSISTEFLNTTHFDEPKTPMGKRTLTSPPNTPKKKQCD